MEKLERGYLSTQPDWTELFRVGHLSSLIPKYPSFKSGKSSGSKS